MLALVAAFAAPVRAACGTACVDGAEAPAYQTDPPCHETAQAPAQPEPAHCSHNHNTSMKPAARAAIDPVTLHVAALSAPLFSPMLAYGFAGDAGLQAAPRGSPPLRNLPLRI